MRRILPLLLCLFLLCSLAACGEEPASDAVPMPTDGGDEAQIQLDPNDPLSNYLDLCQLPAETVSAATQTLDLTSESNGCQAVLQKAVGDAMTLYLSVAVTYPESVDLSASLPLAQTSGSGSYGTTSVVVTEGTVTDPGQMPAESDLEGLSGVGLQSSQMGDHTLQYLITLHFQDAVLTPGREVMLLFADQLGDNTHLFHWTVENQAPVQQAELAAEDGTVVGTGVFSPFAACLTFPEGSLLATEADRLLEALAFLDQAEAALPAFQGTAITGGGTSAPVILEAQAFVPMMPEEIHAVQIGTQTFQVHWTGNPS